MSIATEVADTELGDMIVRSEDTPNGKPRISGHRIGVRRVAGWWKLGLSMEEVGQRLSALTPAKIHAALAYYHLHREEIECYLQEEREACRNLEQKTPGTS